eukprot:3770440-Amphidinium_carterae.1
MRGIVTESGSLLKGRVAIVPLFKLLTSVVDYYGVVKNSIVFGSFCSSSSSMMLEAAMELCAVPEQAAVQ